MSNDEMPKINESSISGRTFSTRFLRKLGYVGISEYIPDSIIIFSTGDIEQVSELNNSFYNSMTQ